MFNNFYIEGTISELYFDGDKSLIALATDDQDLVIDIGDLKEELSVNDTVLVCCYLGDAYEERYGTYHLFARKVYVPYRSEEKVSGETVSNINVETSNFDFDEELPDFSVLADEAIKEMKEAELAAKVADNELREKFFEKHKQALLDYPGLKEGLETLSGEDLAREMDWVEHQLNIGDDPRNKF